MKEVDRLMKNRGPGTEGDMPEKAVRKLAKWLAIERNAASHIQKIKNKYTSSTANIKMSE